MSLRFKATNSDQMLLYLKGSPKLEICSEILNQGKFYGLLPTQEKKKPQKLLCIFLNRKNITVLELYQDQSFQKVKPMQKLLNGRQKRGQGEVKKSDERKIQLQNKIVLVPSLLSFRCKGLKA